MESKLTERTHYIDIARGIAIILVVIGHGISEYSTGFTTLENIIYSFHMPLFFVISGLVFRVKDGDTFPAFAKKRAKGLMLPYLLFAALIFASHLAEKLVFHTDSRFFEELKTKSGIINTLLLTTKSVFSNLWFLPCMFAAQLILFALLKYGKRKWLTAVLCIAPALIIIFLSPQISLPLCLETALVSVAFLFLGTQIKDCTEKKPVLLLIIFVLAFAAARSIWALCCEQAAFSYYNVQFDAPWLFIPLAVCGSMAVIAFSAVAKKSALLELLGRHSLYIFGFHYLVQNILRILVEKSGLGINNIILLTVTTIINLALCTVLSVVWGKIKAAIKRGAKKEA